MNKFFLFSAALLWLTYAWSPVEAQTDRCAQYTTNRTCLSDGGCGCTYLICNSRASCVAANETTGRPLNMPKCTSSQWWYICAGNDDDQNETPAVKAILIVLSCAIIIGAGVGAYIWYRARRRRYATVV